MTLEVNIVNLDKSRFVFCYNEKNGTFLLILTTNKVR